MERERIGEYRLVDEVARTATSTTYTAVHAVLPRRAVIRLMESATHHIAVRALREAYYLETLDHPGVARLFESARLPDRRPWFARELVDGPTIAQHYPRAFEGDTLELVRRLRDIAAILVHAHQRGVVHAGIRPDRIILARRPAGFTLCICDWSDARAHDAAATAFIGSPETWQYVAPELARGDAIDDRADVFALGVVAYKLITGVLPYERGAIHARSSGEILLPTEARAADSPHELTALVDQMLSFDRWDRPSSTECHRELSYLAESVAASTLRVRKPRWTPQTHLATPEHLLAATTTDLPRPPEDYAELEIALTETPDPSTSA
ncbi:MAG TPA: serine/threonine-protein kinase [Kofleriaceae bacterium]|jgi:serine/threonine protein kinase